MNGAVAIVRFLHKVVVEQKVFGRQPTSTLYTRKQLARQPSDGVEACRSCFLSALVSAASDWIWIGMNE